MGTNVCVHFTVVTTRGTAMLHHADVWLVGEWSIDWFKSMCTQDSI